MREDALFRIASMTKPINSIAFMQLVEQCKIALEVIGGSRSAGTRRSGHLCGRWGRGTVRAGKARAANALCRPDDPHVGPYLRIQNRTSVDAAYRDAELDLARRQYDSDEYLELLASIPLEFAPGTGWNYSVSTDVLGIAVERLSGKSLGAYFAGHIFGPPGMVDTAFDVTPAQQPRLADAYAYRPGKSPKPLGEGFNVKLGEPARFYSGGGGLEGTIADYHRFAAMLLGKGALDGARIIAPTTLDLMTANHLPGGVDLTQMSQSLFSEANNAGTGFGLVFAMVIDPARTLMPASMGEFYWGGAYSGAFFVDPVERITCIFMTQLYPSSTYPIRRQLKTLIYSALVESYA